MGQNGRGRGIERFAFADDWPATERYVSMSDQPDRRADASSQSDDLRAIQSGMDDMQAGRSMSIEESKRRVDEALANVNTALGQAAVEAALLEGLESGPPQEWTQQDWEALRRRLVRRHPAEKA